MQSELRQTQTPREIDILGINAAGQESGNQYITQSLPWLQDTNAANVWGAWGVEWRDVVVLNSQNKAVAVYNLTVHNLARPAARDSLMQILQSVAAYDSVRFAVR